MRNVLVTGKIMTMRIAIAGGGGFAFILAAEIAQSTNAVLVLSTRVSKHSRAFSTGTSSVTLTSSLISIIRSSKIWAYRWLLLIILTPKRWSTFFEG